MKNQKLFVFDFDGTLADTKGLLTKGATDYSLQHNMPIPNIEAIAIGYSNPDSYDFGWGLIGEEQRYHMDKMFIDIANKITDGTYTPDLFDYTQEMLKTLNNSKHDIALCTAREKQPCVTTLQKYEILDIFKSFRTREDVTERNIKPKPNPDLLLEIIDELKFHKNDVYMVGDTVVDIQIAKNSGVKSVAVSWGYHDEKTLKQENPDYYIKNFREILKIV
jgi:phosphoglycolate phosphatase